MKTIIFGLFVLIAQPSFADEASQLLLNSITVCPESANPLAALKAADANSFGSPTFVQGSAETIQVEMIKNLQLLNPMIKAPVVIKGTMLVSMTYPEPGFGLVCTVGVKP